ncbi:MAG: hypothetical protein IT280_00095 [Ignavibacteria bacterium]|nr:hypothetical protein [Ignavibacteria bacterium]
MYKHQAIIPGYFRLANSIFFDRAILAETLKTIATNQLKNTKKFRQNRTDDRHGLMD